MIPLFFKGNLGIPKVVSCKMDGFEVSAFDFQSSYFGRVNSWISYAKIQGSAFFQVSECTHKFCFDFGNAVNLFRAGEKMSENLQFALSIKIGNFSGDSIDMYIYDIIIDCMKLYLSHLYTAVCTYQLQIH